MPAASLAAAGDGGGRAPEAVGRSSRSRRATAAAGDVPGRRGRRARPRGQRGSGDAGAAHCSTGNGSGEHCLARARRASRSRRGYGPRRSRRAERQWGRQAGSGTAERGRRAGRRRCCAPFVHAWAAHALLFNAERGRPPDGTRGDRRSAPTRPCRATLSGFDPCLRWFAVARCRADASTASCRAGTATRSSPATPRTAMTPVHGTTTRPTAPSPVFRRNTFRYVKSLSP